MVARHASREDIHAELVAVAEVLARRVTVTRVIIDANGQVLQRIDRGFFVTDATPPPTHTGDTTDE